MNNINSKRVVWTKDTVLTGWRQLLNSASGNPHFMLYLSDGSTMKTAKDAQINYGITNAEWHGVPVRLHCNDQGIYGIERLGE